MGLFGDLDAADVSDNPFFVPADVYTCQLTDFKLKESNSGGYGLSFVWTIQEDDSEYDGNNVSEWINVYIKDSDAKDAAALKRDRARLKSRLTAIGMSTEEMNKLAVEVDDKFVIDEDIADQYIGVMALVTVVNTPDKNDPDKIYVNIRSISLSEDE